MYISFLLNSPNPFPMHHRLEGDGQYAKAAGWALFHGDMERSIKSLSQGGQQMKLMSTAVAGYYSHAQLALDPSHSSRSATNSNSNVWRELCRDMAVELDDPYLRAIFAYVSNGDWKDVLDDVGLPIRERLGVALRWLRDEELTNYLEDLTHKVVGDGDLDGIVVTGISEKAVSLLQVYVNRTGDVQTAALVACFAVPRYFQDDRVGYWVESYRQLLNSWRLFHARAKFDVSRGKMSRNRNGIMTIDGVQRQVYVRCTNCNKVTCTPFLPFHLKLLTRVNYCLEHITHIPTLHHNFPRTPSPNRPRHSDQSDHMPPLQEISPPLRRLPSQPRHNLLQEDKPRRKDDGTRGRL